MPANSTSPKYKSGKPATTALREQSKYSHLPQSKVGFLVPALIHLSQSTPGIFLTWGVFGIQLGNLIVIIAMFVVFTLALVLPFPRSDHQRGEQKK
ncbi:MAG: hypothetical protein ABIW32_06450 [Terrimesophilobacter sp.]